MTDHNPHPAAFASGWSFAEGAAKDGKPRKPFRHEAAYRARGGADATFVDGWEAGWDAIEAGISLRARAARRDKAIRALEPEGVNA